MKLICSRPKVEFTLVYAHACVQQEDELFFAEKYSTATTESVGITGKTNMGCAEPAAGAEGENHPSQYRLPGSTAAEAWVAGPTMTTGPRCFAAAASVEGSLFVIGGNSRARV